METFWTVLGLAFLLALLVTPVAAVAYYSWRSLRDYRAGQVWKRWAAARNWGYKLDWPALGQRLGRLPRPAMSLVSGTERGWWGRFNNVPVFGGRVSVETGSGRERRVRFCQLVGARIEGADLPRLTVHPQGLPMPGDAQFESGRFNKDWVVLAADPQDAHKVMNPRLMSLLMESRVRFTCLWLQGDGAFLLWPDDDSPAATEERLELLTRVVGLLPRYFVEDHGGELPVVDNSGAGIAPADIELRMAELARIQRVGQPLPTTADPEPMPVWKL